MVDIWLDQYFAAFFAALLSLCREIERSWVQILYKTRLSVDVSVTLLDRGHRVEVKVHVEGLIEAGERYDLFLLSVRDLKLI